MVMSAPQSGTKSETNEQNQVAASPASTTMAQSSFIPVRPAPTGPIVTHFKPSNKRTLSNSTMFEEFVTDDYCVDKESVHRKFGWGMLGNIHHIPFIYRKSIKYCAVRMVDKYIFENFILKISDNIYFGCTRISAYYITIPESMLLNEINEFHCDNFYGSMPFKQGDVLVKLDDANQFYDFLTVCTNKLFNRPSDEKRCGFLTINEKSMVPYVVVKDQKLVPLFYFDGMDGIKFKVQTIKDWNLSYLKFCFKVHGIRDEFCKNEDCRVIVLDELIQYLDPGDTFKEWWPTISRSNKGLMQPKNVNKNTVKAWHQNPVTVLPVSTVKYAKQFPNKTGTSVPAASNVYYSTISHS